MTSHGEFRRYFAERDIRRECKSFASATTSGRASAYDFRPPHLPVAAFLRSRAALSFATRDVFSNWAIAPSTCRTSTAVGVSSVKKSGAVAGISEILSD
jgi:hypothetical protein